MRRKTPDRAAAAPSSAVGQSSKMPRVIPPDALGVATRLAAERLRGAGISPEPLIEEAGLSLDQVNNRDMRIPVAGQIRFLELAANALLDPLLGFRLACRCDLREMRLLHYAAGAAATLGEAMRRFERYSSIVNEGVVIKCSGNLSVQLSYAGVARHSDQQQIEFLATTIVRSCRALTGLELKPISVHLVHRPPRRGSEFETYFGCRVSFGAETDRITFDKETGLLPLVGADPYLDDILLDYCEQALAARVNASALQAAIENAITPLLPHGEANFDEVARKLGVSRRTLARRLKAEGLSFGEVLKELRVDLAKRYLTDGNLSISQIAWLVGFQSVAAFSHSCKRWTGMSPKLWRSALLAA